MSERISPIIKQLQAEEEKLDGELSGLKSQVAEYESALKRVRGAMRELGGKPTAGKGTRKPAASKSEVIDAILEVLQSDGVLEEAELKAAVETKITEGGRSRMGFALRFKEALQDERFVDSPGGYRIKEQERAEKQGRERVAAKA